MGRDVAGLRIDKKSNMSNNYLKSTRSSAAHVAAQGLPENAEKSDLGHEDHIARRIVTDECNEKQDVLGKKSAKLEPEEKIIEAEVQKSPDKKLRSPANPGSGSAVNGTTDGTSLSPNHVDGTENNHAAVEVLFKSNDLQSPDPAKKSEPTYHSMSRKHLYPGSKSHYDEDDNWSLASSVATSVRTTKITVPVAPKFTVVDRLERRKEFYTKLEEKHKALEQEKLEYEARVKEEEQNAIRQMRKNMAYRANPVPSFYREGPPAKVELKKLPVTRPKSPNFSRRKSCGDAAVKSSPEERVPCGRARHSIGTYKEGKPSPLTSKGKGQNVGPKLNGSNKARDRPPQQINETTESFNGKGKGNSDTVVELES